MQSQNLIVESLHRRVYQRKKGNIYPYHLNSHELLVFPISKSCSFYEFSYDISGWISQLISKFLLENNVRIAAKLFKLNLQEEKNFSVLIEACEALSFKSIDRAPLREYLDAAG